jgi:hypothetical protein
VRYSWRPFSAREVDVVRHEASISLSRIVTLVRVCELAGVSRSSVYASCAATVVAFVVIRGPKTLYCDARLTEEIRAVLAASPFVGEGYRKVWAKLRHRSIRTSRTRVLRLMRAAGLLAPSGVGAARGPRAHDGTIIPAAPNDANVAQGLTVRHDHGSQYLSDAFQKELAFLGVESSPAFVGAPEGNG